MKATLALIALLVPPCVAAWGQTAAIPTKQIIQTSFDGDPNRITLANNPIIPFVPIEFDGVWPEDVTKLTFRLLNTSTQIPYEQVRDDLSRLRSFDYGDIASITKEKMTNWKATSDTAKTKRDSTAFESYDADVLLDGIYDSKTIIKDPLGGAHEQFAVTLLAPQLRRYYGVQVLAEGIDKSVRVLCFATEGVDTPCVANAKLAGGGIPILYAGDLDNLPHERFIPYSAVGVGFLDIDDHPIYPFLLTSVGLIISARPIYSGVKTPFIHRYSQRGWGRPANWFMNRLFFSGGITTASLTYRGRALATSAVKGTVGTGLFLLPGMGVSFDCSFGGVANYNTVFDPRTKPFFMLGASLRFTGQVTQIFKSSVGASIDPQFSK